MFRPILLIFLLSLLLFAKSANYNFVLDDRMWLMPCESEYDEGNTPFSDLVDASKLEFILADDFETFYINGEIVIKKELPKGPIKMDARVLRWERSQWVPTILSLKRDDFCHAMANPFEPWFILIAQIPKEQRICPPVLGHVYQLQNVTNHMRMVNMPRADIEGPLRAVVHFTAGDVKTCSLMHLSVTTD